MTANAAYTALLHVLTDQGGDLSNIALGARFLSLPWSHAAGQAWDVEYILDIAHSQLHSAAAVRRALERRLLGSLVLYPAPGEWIHLDIDVVDDGLGVAMATMLATVRRET